MHKTGFGIQFFKGGLETMDRDEEKILLHAVVVFLTNNGRVLLAKKLKKIGKDLWNGYGGGIEVGESPRSAAIRELREETGGCEIDLATLKKRALIDFHNTTSDGRQFICKVHVYVVVGYSGPDPQETEEMGPPAWFPFNDLPFAEMMPGDNRWLPSVLVGQKVRGSIYYSPFQRELLQAPELRIVHCLDE